MFSKKYMGIVITIIGAVILMVRATFLYSTVYAQIFQIIGLILFFGGGILIPDFTGVHKQKKEQ
ncbi:hypothetical protein N780_01010 [Pontibacillus chungwhensis BH030062]|uniref:Uncharacterized protein n=1 Tax=Pontibacillus chungwhensis BH030062 TaxID=1385513 RepID=A0A0A2VFJ4_9BACI|nr:hypothetical protein [Pontibacillus chungwhensis]KGP92365.1 hypothetical protein N780_01010 [Pontibacillus chungwhensis BH030062]